MSKNGTLPGPKRIAEGGPLVVVTLLPPYIHQAIDSAGATKDTTARLIDVAPVQMRLGLALEAPVVLLVEHRLGVANGDVQPVVVVARTRLQQFDCVAAVLAQPVRENTAGRTGTNDHKIELFHHLSPARTTLCCCPI